jgi:polysaccharide export outer membrane protein
MNQPVFQARNPRYTLHIGDTIEIDLPLVPTFNQVSIIQPDGYITLHNLGELRIAGKTVPEATEAIKQAYSKIMQNPVITLELKDFERPYFIASGEVARPGKYELRGETTVTEAMAIAGGISDVGKKSQVLLFRRISDNDVRVKRLNLKKMFDDKNLREDVYLQPGDLLFIPKSSTSAAIKALLPHTTTGLYLPVR